DALQMYQADSIRRSIGVVVGGDLAEGFRPPPIVEVLHGPSVSSATGLRGHCQRPLERDSGLPHGAVAHSRSAVAWEITAGSRPGPAEFSAVTRAANAGRTPGFR